MYDDDPLSFLFRAPNGNGNGFHDALARCVDPVRRASDAPSPRFGDDEMCAALVGSQLYRVAAFMLDQLSIVENYERRPAEQVRAAGDWIVRCLGPLLDMFILLNDQVSRARSIHDRIAVLNEHPDLTQDAVEKMERIRDATIVDLRHLDIMLRFTYPLREFYGRWNRLFLNIGESNAAMLDRLYAAAAELDLAVGAAVGAINEKQ